ncbi:MAG: outer membrane protein assembly factor BamA [Nitrospirae bacterium]|nr:outer membrane protein assembly factor BamA [Nitrospirota bacterium]
MEDDELIDLICFRVGEILDREALGKGLRRAFKKGVFLDVQAVSEPYDDGIKLIYVVREIPVIDKIRVEGNKYISGKEIKRIIPYKEDEDFKEEYIGKATNDLFEFYKRKGYPYAAINITPEASGKKSAVALRVDVSEGQPLIINTVVIDEALRLHIRTSEGDIFDRDTVERDLKRLKDYLKDEGYFNPVIGPYAYDNGNLVIPVDKGKKLELNFKGNSVIGAKKLRKETPFFEYESADDEAVQEAIDRIRNLYYAEGYYYAQIAAGVQSEEDAIEIDFVIFEGEKVLLTKISFEGISISPDAIKGIIQLEEGKPYDENLLTASKDTIIRFYGALGYLRTEIRSVEKAFRKDGGEVELKFDVVEGPQTKIKEVRISGNEDIPADEIQKALQIHEGDPYNAVDLGDARYRALSLYGRHGYMDARVSVESRINEEGAFIIFNITENRPSVLGKLIISGNRKTKAKIIEREFTVKEGETSDYEEQLRTKQRLYMLGIFNEVSIDMLEPDREEENRIVRDMLVSVKEGKPGSVELSLGFADYEGARGALDISYNNLGGYNRQIGLRTEISAVKKRYTLSFREPWLFNQRNLPFNAFLTKEDTRSVNLDTKEVLYELDKMSLVLAVEKEIEKGLKAGLSYEYSFVDTKDVAPGVILSREDSGTLGIGSVSPSLFYDTRDDPFDPSRGSLNGVVVKLASTALLSETEFIKGTFQSSWFIPLPKKIVFAFSLRGGAGYSYDNIKELPLVERFFLGGRTTVRGYTNDTLGPKAEDGTPTGGNIFALTNAEFRIPLGKGFGLVTFLDAGNVWQLAENIEAELKYTTGAGLRYKTPVGPIRIDYGHKMNKEPDESSGEVHFSFGHAF